MPKIPDDLMERLRRATENFHQARMRVDGVGKMNDSQKRDLGAALRAAEKELEDVTAAIDKFLPPIPPTAPGTKT